MSKALSAGKGAFQACTCSGPGVKIFEARTLSLRQVADVIGDPEGFTCILGTQGQNGQSRALKNFSTVRKEAGAIQDIALRGPDDCRNSSPEAAIGWLSNLKTGGGYVVEIFETLPNK